jgi:hypothetical protein
MKPKARENRARRAAERQGLRLTKSRRRDPRALDYAKYWLVDDRSNILDQRVDQQFGLDLEDVEGLLGIRHATASDLP